MNAYDVNKIDTNMLRSLVASSNLDRPSLGSTERDFAVSLCQAAVTDFAILRQVCLTLIQELHLSDSVGFPKTFVNGLHQFLIGQLNRAVATQDFTPNFEFLYEVVDRGLEGISDSDLLEIVTSPTSLCLLYEGVNEVMPDAWMKQIQEAGQSRMKWDGVNIRPRQMTSSLGGVKVESKVQRDHMFAAKFMPWLTIAATLACVMLSYEVLTRDSSPPQLVNSGSPEPLPRSLVQSSVLKGDIEWQTIWDLFLDENSAQENLQKMMQAGPDFSEYIDALLNERNLSADEALAVIKSRVDAESHLRELKISLQLPAGYVTSLKEKGLSDAEIIAYISLK